MAKRWENHGRTSGFLGRYGPDTGIYSRAVPTGKSGARLAGATKLRIAFAA